uniref:lantibiotic dehydratase C-terminal domain-containing protein n=1 Tax=Nonomuraea pusilla TaxID=46177 RepID=UPI0009E71785|nr:lantibiotic dehydratase C-terminal domain-containing protein [Nonomuraea pusilla]
MPREEDWISVHAFYQGDLDRLLVGPVDGLMAELSRAGLIDRWFFLRYWDGGPHVRLRVLPAGQTARQAVESLLFRDFRRYFAAHPSQNRLTEPEYLRMAQELARWEGLTSYAPRQWPNNSLQRLPYRREHRRYGAGASMEAAERHFGESSELVMQVLRKGPTRERRLVGAYAMILLGWFACLDAPAELAATIGATGSRLERPPDVWLGHATDMLRIAANAELLRQEGTLIAWFRSVRALADVVETQIDSGGFDPPVRGWEGSRPVAETSARGRAVGVLDICAHLACNRLGVTLAEESAVRELAVRAVGALAGRSAVAP